MYSHIIDTSRRFFVYYWDNGNVLFKGYMKGKMRDGTWHHFYSNGKISKIEKFSNNLKVGSTSFFDKSGRKVKEEVYESGKLIKITDQK